MKKLFLAIAISGFITFGAVGIQQIIASTNSVEMANVDKNPKKNSDKKNKDNKATNESAMKSESSVKRGDSGCRSHCCDECSPSDCHQDGGKTSKESPDIK